MSSENNPSETTNAKTETSSNNCRRGPDKRFTRGAVAVLVLCALGLWYLNSSPREKYVAVPPSGIQGEDYSLPDNVDPSSSSYDESLPLEGTESDTASSSAVASTEEETSTEVTTDDGGTDRLVTQKSGAENIGGVGYVNYNLFKQAAIPAGTRRFVMGDEASLTTISFAGRQCPIYADSQLLYDLCNGSLRLPSDKEPTLSRAAYALQKHGRELQFYHMPLCLISKTDWDSVLTAISEACKKNPDANIQINVPFKQTNADIQKMAADQLNDIYGLSGENAIKPSQVVTPSYNSFDVYVGTDNVPTFKGGNGEDVGFTISGKASDLQKKFFPIIRYQSSGIPFKVVYNIDGEIFQRNLQQETIQRVMSLNNIYNYYKDRKVELSSIDVINAGGGVVNVNCGVFSGTFKLADQETYSKSDLTGYVEESELNRFYLSQQTIIRRYYDIQFGSDPTPVTQVPEWKELFPNLTALVIPLKDDGTLDIKPDDKDKAEKEKLFDDYWTAIKTKLSNSPESIETLKKLLPNENILEDGKGIVNVRADRFFGLDIVKKKFREGIKIYKLDQSDIDQGLSFLSLGLKHIYGSYPVTASAILFYGKTRLVLQQGYYPIPLGANVTFPKGAHRFISGVVPEDGKFYFQSNAASIKDDKTSDDYCLGREESGTRFSINVFPLYDKGTKKISAILECVIESDEQGGSISGKYVLRQKIEGTEAVDKAFSYIKYPDTVEVGTVLDSPKNKFASDLNMLSSYDDSFRAVRISATLNSRSVHGCEHGYNNMKRTDEIRDKGERFLTGYHNDELPKWFFNHENDKPFYIKNITYFSHEKDSNGRLQPGLIEKSLVTDQNGNPITSNCFLFEGEHHNAYTTDARTRWHKIWGRVHFRRHYACQTYYNVEFRVLSGNYLTIPFTYVVRPAEMEYTVVGSIGGGAHYYLDSKRDRWLPMTNEEYNARCEEVKSNISSN